MCHALASERSHTLFLLGYSFPLSSAAQLLFSLQLKCLGPWIVSMWISRDPFCVFTAWWLDSRSERLKRTRWKMHCLYDLSLEVTQHRSVFVPGPPRLKGRENGYLPFQREECPSHVIRGAHMMGDVAILRKQNATEEGGQCKNYRSTEAGDTQHGCRCL